MTLVYICRHGEAQPYAAKDAERALTERGRTAVKTLWQGLLQEGVQPTRIVCSPYLRAQQTAATINEVLGGVAVLTEPLITPEARVSDVFAWLAEQNNVAGTLFVSHMPLVGLWLGQWVQGIGASVGMPVGAVAAVAAQQAAPAGADLRWFKRP